MPTEPPTFAQDQRAQIEELRKAGIRLSAADVRAFLMACRWRNMQVKDLVNETLIVAAQHYRTSPIPEAFFRADTRRTAPEVSQRIDVHRRRIAPRTRERILYLTRTTDMSIAEIAEATNTSFNSVRRTLGRASVGRES